MTVTQLKFLLLTQDIDQTFFGSSKAPRCSAGKIIFESSCLKNSSWSIKTSFMRHSRLGLCSRKKIIRSYYFHRFFVYLLSLWFPSFLNYRSILTKQNYPTKIAFLAPMVSRELRVKHQIKLQNFIAIM